MLVHFITLIDRFNGKEIFVNISDQFLIDKYILVSDMLDKLTNAISQSEKSNEQLVFCF
jgi:hypothetical protein